MDIDKKLIEKYFKGECTLEEEKKILDWLESGDFDGGLELPNKVKQQMKTRIWQKVSNKVSFPVLKTTPAHRKYLQVGVAACIICISFFGGRLSAKNLSANTKETSALKEHLYVNGGKDMIIDIPGDEFKIKFEGTLQLYNASREIQTINTGDSTLTLLPSTKYFLIGSSDKPKLIHHLSLGPGEKSPVPNIKEISILRTDFK
ncbi:MAG: hypothetical protein AAGF96_00010 [Bacteroidota bacterium]